MSAYLKRMPSGIPGDVSRKLDSVVEQCVLNPSLPFAGYGLPGKFAGGKLVPLVAGDLGSVVEAFNVRPYPTQTVNADGTGVSASVIGDKLRFGFMTVQNNAGTPVQGGQVYVRTGNASAGKPIDGIEAVAENVVTAVAGANTGNGTFGTIIADATAVPGAYKLTMLTATTFSLSKPDGVQLKNGATGVAYTGGGLGFTLTAGGTAFVANDSFTLTNVQNATPIPNCIFEDAGDASGNVEIRFNV